MKIAAYLRVSTKDQKVDIQNESINSYCKMKGWSNPVLFIDHAESGAKTSRPQFNLMMDAVRKNEFDLILCWKFDRIGRSTIHLLSIMGELNALKIGFVSIMENIDTTTPMGKMMFSVIAALSEFERETIRQRTKSGIDLAKSKGVHCGRPDIYTNKDKMEVIAYYNQGITPDKIASMTKMDRSTVYRIIKKSKV
jgi:DNA invertase Pin-like site-specific DNA recombinase